LKPSTYGLNPVPFRKPRKETADLSTPLRSGRDDKFAVNIGVSGVDGLIELGFSPAGLALLDKNAARRKKNRG
jgi:hypothetical protein